MPSYGETLELKPGLILFRRKDVQHQNWYCRIKLSGEDRYKTYPCDTPIIDVAKNKAFEHDADVRFREKHAVPIFEKSFEKLAENYLVHLKAKVDIGDMQLRRYKLIESFTRRYVIPYHAGTQVAAITPETWRQYRAWRKRTAKEEHEKKLLEGRQSRDGGNPKDATIRDELTQYRAILVFGVSKGDVKESQIARDQIVVERKPREEFTPEQYRHLHTHARTKWIKQAKSDVDLWYRTVVYNCMLILTNTGMRATEAKRQRWSHISVGKDRAGNAVALIRVRGKGKFRTLVADISVMEYFNRIRAVSKATGPEDFVFSGYKGVQARNFYSEYFSDLLNDAKLRTTDQGTVRCASCFRHTYATFRLMHGTNIHSLARQMGTSVKELERTYSHVIPLSVAEDILLGVPKRDPVDDIDGIVADVNVSGTETKPTRRPTRHKPKRKH